MPRALPSFLVLWALTVVACGSPKAPETPSPRRLPGPSVPQSAAPPDEAPVQRPSTSVSAAAVDEVDAQGHGDRGDVMDDAERGDGGGSDDGGAVATASAELRSRTVDDAVSAAGAMREPLVVTPLPELCRLACDNTQRLVLAELPSDTAQAMRDEVERAMAKDCPGRCLQRASLESARCIAQAKTALELAACP